MADGYDIIIIMLATYRLATDLAGEDGPADLFSRLRGWALQRFGAAHWITVGVHCPICVAFWVAPLAIALQVHAPFAALWLAAAGATALALRWRGGA